MGTETQFGIRINWLGKDAASGTAEVARGLSAIGSAADGAGRTMTTSMSAARRGVESISQQLRVVQSLWLTWQTGGLFKSLVTDIVQSQSAMQAFSARIRAATDDQKAWGAAQRGVMDLAQRYGQSLDAVGAAYARLNPALQQLGGGTQQTLRMLDGLSAGFRLSGATAAEQSAVLLQFAQAMGSGRVQGDEFRSMMESAQPVMRAVAQTLGVTTGQLRKLAEDGKLTSEVFGNALLKSVDALQAKAAGIPLTFDQAAQAAKNAATQMAAAFGDGLMGGGAASGMSSITQALTQGSAAARALGEMLRDASGYAATLAAAVAASYVGPAIQAWIARESQALVALAQRTAATYAQARAERDLAQAKVQQLTATQAALAVEREEALAQIASANATLRATQAIGAQSVALAANRDAMALRQAAQVTLISNTAAAAQISKELTVAQSALSSAQTAVSVSNQAAAVGVRAFNGALALLGGPVGVALIALGALGYKYMQVRDAAEKAALATKAYGDVQSALQNGSSPQERQVSKIRALVSELQDELDKATVAGDTVQADAIKRKLAPLQTQLDYVDNAVAKVAQGASKAAEKALSDSSAYDQLTKGVQTRARLMAAYQQEIANLDKAFDAKAKTLSGQALVAAQKDLDDVKQAKLGELNKALANLPGVKSAAQQVKEAAREANQTANETLRAQIEDIKAGLKLGLSEIDELGKQQSLSVLEVIQRRANLTYAAIQAQAGLLSARLKATVDPSERAKLKGQIDELYRATETASAEARSQAAAERRNQSQTLAQWLDQQRSANEQLVFENSLLGQNATQQALAKAQRQADLELRSQLYEAYVDENGQLAYRAKQLLPELAQQYRSASAASLELLQGNVLLQAQREASPYEGMRRAVQEFGQSAASVADNYKQVWGNAMRASSTALAQFVQTGKLDFRSLADSIVADLLRIQAEKLIAGIAGSLFGGGGGVGFADSSRVAGYQLAKNALGGVYESPSLHSYVNGVYDRPQMFAFARGGVFAEVGPEAIMPLALASDGSLGVRNVGGAASLKVEIIDQRASSTAAPVETQPLTGADGGLEGVRVIVRDMVKAEMAAGRMDSAMRGRYGLSPLTTGRG